MTQPLIRRSALYDFLPQVPDWFCNVGHFAGKYRFRRKAKRLYKQEEVLNCSWCGGSEFLFIANQERHGLPISVMLCETCAFMFTSPRWDEASLSDHYRRDYRDIERGTIPDLHAFMFGLQADKGPILWPAIAQQLGARGIMQPRVAEIGCGEGGLLSWIKDNASADVTGFELNLGASAYGRAKNLDIRSTHFTRESGSFHVIILEQVLEHLHNPATFLAMVAATQEPGSLLAVGVPGILESTAHYDSNFLVYLDYAHMSHFCLHTLERLVASHGYRLLKGDETIFALFERTAGPGQVVIPPRPAAEIALYLTKGENDFKSRGSHLMRNARAYIKYVLAGCKSLVRRWINDPLFQP